MSAAKLPLKLYFMEPLRVKITQPVVLGNKTLNRGLALTLSNIIKSLPSLLSLNKVKIEPPEKPSGYIVALMDLPEGKLMFEVFDETDLEPPRLTLYVNQLKVLRLDDRELASLFRCGGCNAAFLEHSALLRHKELTGHKRPYRKKTENTSQENLE